jgi:hypothetical protein
MVFVRGENLLFVVAALGVDFPGVEFGSAEEAEGGVVEKCDKKRMNLRGEL